MTEQELNDLIFSTRGETASPQSAPPGVQTPLSSEEQTINDLIFATRETSPTGEVVPPREPVSGMQSLAAGFQDTATLGNAGQYRAGRDAFNSTLGNLVPDALKGPIADAFIKYGPLGMAGETAGLANSAVNLLTGDPAVNSDEAVAQVDQELEDNRGMSMLGQVGGALLPATGMAKAGGLALGAVGKGIPYLSKVAQFFANTRFGRVAANAVGGGLEGAAYSTSKDEDVVTGTALGTLGGALGGVAGEAIGAGARALTGSGANTEARVALRNEMKKASRTIANPEGAVDIDPGAIVRPDSTLMDVNSGVRQTMSTAIRQPHMVDDFWQARNLLSDRFKQQGGELDLFEQRMKDLLPKGFTRQAGNVTDPRAGDVVAKNAKNYFTSLQGEYDTFLKNSNPTFNPNEVLSKIKAATVGNNPKPDEGIRESAKILNSLLKAEKPNDLRGMLNLRKSIDMRIDDSLKPDAKSLDKSARRSLVQARNVVNEYLDSVPGFTELNAKYATEASYNRAYEVGSNILKNNKKALSPQMLEDYMSTANPGDMQGFWEGISRDIIDSMSKTDGERALVKKLTKDDNIVKKLNEVFPNEAPQMVEAANKVIDNLATSNEVLSGSRTSLDQARSQRVSPSFNFLDKMVVALSGINIASSGKFGTSQAAGIGALGRTIPKKSTDPAFTAELQRLFLAQGPEGIQKALGQIRQTEDMYRLPVTLGGRDKALAMQAGELPNTLINNLTTYDLGSTVPNTAAAVAPAIGLNFPQSFEERRDERDRRKHKRKKKQ